MLCVYWHRVSASYHRIIVCKVSSGCTCARRAHGARRVVWATGSSERGRACRSPATAALTRRRGRRRRFSARIWALWLGWWLGALVVLGSGAPLSPLGAAHVRPKAPGARRSHLQGSGGASHPKAHGSWVGSGPGALAGIRLDLTSGSAREPIPPYSALGSIWLNTSSHGSAPPSSVSASCPRFALTARGNVERPGRKVGGGGPGMGGKT